MKACACQINVIHSAYFKLNRDLLVEIVSKDKIRTFHDPPPFPQLVSNTRFSLPPFVETVKLLPPRNLKGSEQLLAGDRYDTRLFKKVEECFKRFYVPSDPHMVAILDEVEVVFNPALEERFQSANAELEERFARSVVGAKGGERSALQQSYLDHLFASENLERGSDANPIFAWHAVTAKQLDSIRWYGLPNPSTPYPGIFS